MADNKKDDAKKDEKKPDGEAGAAPKSKAPMMIGGGAIGMIALGWMPRRLFAIAVALMLSPRIGSWMLIAGAAAAIATSFLDLRTPCGCLGASNDLPASYRRLIASAAGLLAVLLLQDTKPARPETA